MPEGDREGRKADGRRVGRGEERRGQEQGQDLSEFFPRKTKERLVKRGSRRKRTSGRYASRREFSWTRAQGGSRRERQKREQS